MRNTVLRKSKIPKDGEDVAKLDLKDDSILLNPKECTYLGQLNNEMKNIIPFQKKELQKEFQNAVLVQLRYLQSHLPFQKDFLKNSVFLDPEKHQRRSVGFKASAVTSYLGGFSKEDKTKIGAQVLQYQSLLETQMPEWDKGSSRLDEWWEEVFRLLEVENGEPALELERLVKACCTVSNSQGFVERGFSVTKRVVEDRESLSDESVRAQKLITAVIKSARGTDKVSITTSMMNDVKYASSRKKEVDRQEKERKRRADEDSVCEAEAKKKDAAAEEKLNWEEIKRQI